MLRTVNTLDCGLMPQTNAGAVVRRLRKARDWTQQELANRAKLDRTTIVKLESGEGDHDHRTILNVATALGVSVGDITGTADRESLTRDAVEIARLFDSIQDVEERAWVMKLLRRMYPQGGSSTR